MTDDRSTGADLPDDSFAFGPRQVAGFVLLAALVLAVLRRLRRARRGR